MDHDLQVDQWSDLALQEEQESMRAARVAQALVEGLDLPGAPRPLDRLLARL